MKRYAILLLALSGCVHIPQALDEFRSGGYEVRLLCSNRSPLETYDLLLRESTACYERTASGPIGVPAAGGLVFVPISSGTKIEHELRPDGTSYIAQHGYANHKSSGYFQLIEIGSGQQCATDVKVFQLNSAWKGATVRVEKWLNDQKVSGCGI
jgi:hypothetical protein